MAKFRHIKNAFLGGKFSAHSLSRTDLPLHKYAIKDSLNMIPTLSGAMYKRPGTLVAREIDDTFFEYDGCRLLEFGYVEEDKESYMVAIMGFGEDAVYKVFKVAPNEYGYDPHYSYLRSEGGGLYNASDTYDTKFYPVGAGEEHVGSYAAGDATYAPIDEMIDIKMKRAGNILYLVHQNFNPIRLTRYDNGGYEFRISRYIDHNFAGTARTSTDLQNAVPYLPVNSTAITIDPSAATGTGVTFTASAAFFNLKHVGALFKIKPGTAIGCFRVTGFSSSTSVTGDWVVAPSDSSHAATLIWWESAWSDYRGWPSVVSVFENRLVFGGTKYQPDSLYFSEDFDFNQMSVDSILNPESEPTGTQPFTFTLAAESVNKILWAESGDTLKIGTPFNEWRISRLSSSAVLGADNISAQVQSSFGSVGNKSIRIGSEVVFQSGDGGRLRALSYSNDDQAFVAVPLQQFFDDLPEAEKYGYDPGSGPVTFGRRVFRDLAWDPYRSTIWCCDSMGNWFGLTRDRESGVNAWHRHQLGGYDADIVGDGPRSGSSADENFIYQPSYYGPTGSILSVATLYNTKGYGTELWVAVRRRIKYYNGVGSESDLWVITIERMVGGIYPFESAYDYSRPGPGIIYTDSSIVDYNHYPNAEDYLFDSAGVDADYGSFPSTAVFDHLRGVDLDVTAFSELGIYPLTSVQPSYVGTPGSPSSVDTWHTVTMTQRPYGFESYPFTVSFGYAYDAYLELFDPDAGSQIGSAQAAVKRIHEAKIEFFKTIYAKAGGDSSNLETLVFRTSDTPMTKGVELFTGYKRVFLDSNYSTSGTLYIYSDKPLPLCVTSVISEGVTND